MSKPNLPGSCCAGNHRRGENHRMRRPFSLRAAFCLRKRGLPFRDTSMSHGKPQGDNKGKDERNDTPHDIIMNACGAPVKSARQSRNHHTDDRPSHQADCVSLRLPGRGREAL
jgi:hypothetical protein